jgi:hypothetical protein
MNIEQIKSQIGQPVLTMTRQLDENKQPTSWISHWDNTNRVRVTMHEEVFNKIKADKSFGGLAVKPAQVLTPEGKQPYKLYVIITPKNIEATF